jgi:ABC-type bacteriocin/lantibiotic exporter with double-glycine peptidase domain
VHSTSIRNRSYSARGEYAGSARRILVLDAGRVVQDGSHEELLSCEGPYRRLHGLADPGPT